MNESNKAIGLNPLKKWDESTTEEKLEVLREELRMTRYTTDRVNKLEKEIALLREHQHGIDGKCLVPMRDSRFEASDCAMSYDRLA